MELGVFQDPQTERQRNNPRESRVKPGMVFTVGFLDFNLTSTVDNLLKKTDPCEGQPKQRGQTSDEISKIS